MVSTLALGSLVNSLVVAVRWKETAVAQRSRHAWINGEPESVICVKWQRYKKVLNSKTHRQRVRFTLVSFGDDCPLPTRQHEEMETHSFLNLSLLRSGFHVSSNKYGICCRYCMSMKQSSIVPILLLILFFLFFLTAFAFCDLVGCNLIVHFPVCGRARRFHLSF